MKILILGGTGAMGTHLVNILAVRGNAITVTSRSHRPDIGQVNYVTGNAKDHAFLSSLLAKQWDVIVDFMVYSTEDFKDRVDMLVGATDHYLYLSSARVYADSDTPIVEDSPRILDVSTDREYLATDEYALSKARQEDILFEAKNTNWTIVRPYITYDTERLQLGVLEKEDWLYRVLKGRTLVTSADLQQRYTTLTHGADVAKGMAAIVGNPKTNGEAFHITNSAPIMWQDVLTIYLDVLESYLGKRPRVNLQTMKEFGRWRKGKYQLIYDRLYNRKFCNNKIQEFVDTEKFVQPVDGLKLCLEQFLVNEPLNFRSINWRAEAIKDRLLKEYASISEASSPRDKFKYLLFRYVGIR